LALNAESCGIPTEVKRFETWRPFGASNPLVAGMIEGSIVFENFRVTGFQHDDNNLTVAGAVPVKAVPIAAVLALPPPGAADAIWFGRGFTWKHHPLLRLCVASQTFMLSNLFVASFDTAKQKFPLANVHFMWNAFL